MFFFWLGCDAERIVNEIHEGPASGNDLANRHCSHGSDESKRMGIEADGFITVHPKVK